MFFIFNKEAGRYNPERAFLLDLCSEPHSKPQDFLKLIRGIVPAIVVANRMSS